MADYTTRTLAEKLMPAAAEANIKGATRTLRKFLRDELGQGKAVVGKGNRYALTYNAKEITALKKKFGAWEIAQAEAQKARRDALAAKIAPKIDDAPIEGAEIDSTDEADDATDEVAPIEGPTDEEIAAMLLDDDSDA